MGNYCPSGRATRAREEISDHLTDDLRTKMSMINFKQRAPDGSEVIRSKADILKDYRVVKKIGKGLFSKVYLAIDPSGRKVGLKMILKKDFVAKEAIEKIIIEKEILKRVDHRNVLKLYKTMQTNSKIYFVLEYADKGNLLNIINSKRLSPEQIRVILAQVIEALFYLHSKGIIYGDLKAENILINKAGTVKLCDFNLSGTTSILNDTIQGTVSYIAPEILEGDPRTAKSDFWSLGVLTHLMFYKRLPFKSSNQTELFFNVINKSIEPEPRDNKAPRALRQLICDLLVKNPKRRLGNSMKEFMLHPFFQGFDWKGYQADPRSFSYAEGIPSYDDRNDILDTSNSDQEVKPQTQNQSLNFLYNIDNFTYENKDMSRTSGGFGRSLEPQRINGAGGK